MTGETPMMAEEEAAIFEEFKQVAASQAPASPAAEPEAPSAAEPPAAATSEAPTRAAQAPPPKKEKDESARPELG